MARHFVVCIQRVCVMPMFTTHIDTIQSLPQCSYWLCKQRFSSHYTLHFCCRWKLTLGSALPPFRAVCFCIYSPSSSAITHLPLSSTTMTDLCSTISDHCQQWQVCVSQWCSSDCRRIPQRMQYGEIHQNHHLTFSVH